MIFSREKNLGRQRSTATRKEYISTTVQIVTQSCHNGKLAKSTASQLMTLSCCRVQCVSHRTRERFIVHDSFFTDIVCFTTEIINLLCPGVVSGNRVRTLIIIVTAFRHYLLQLMARWICLYNEITLMIFVCLLIRVRLFISKF